MKIIILAAGIGSRMQQDKPKCACLINNKPMINYLLETCSKLQYDEIIIVVGYKKEELKDVITMNVTYIEQPKQLGTADALKCCYHYLKGYKDDLLIIPGDTPLIKLETLEKIIDFHKEQKNKLTVLSTYMDDPTSFGRIKKEDGKLIKIIEESELTGIDKTIKEVNTGIYLVDSESLLNNIYKITNDNNKKEYYLTDLVEIIKERKNTYIVPYTFHLQGINDYQTLQKIEGMLND